RCERQVEDVCESQLAGVEAAVGAAEDRDHCGPPVIHTPSRAAWRRQRVVARLAPVAHVPGWWSTPSPPSGPRTLYVLRFGVGTQESVTSSDAELPFLAVRRGRRHAGLPGVGHDRTLFQARCLGGGRRRPAVRARCPVVEASHGERDDVGATADALARQGDLAKAVQLLV